jgi:hypothetical protein
MPGMADIELLGLLVEADEVAGDDQTWVLYPRGDGSGIFIGVNGWPKDVEALSQHQIDDLEDEGWVRVLKRDGNARTFAARGAGRRAWAEHVARRSHPPSRVEVDWDRARPLLEQVYETYLDAGAPEEGIDALRVTQLHEDLRQAQALIRELIRDDWLVEGLVELDQADFVRPSPKAIRTFGGWPGGSAQDALNEFVEDLDQAIDSSPHDEKRTKLIAIRDGLLSAGRDVALAYFEKKVVGV